MRSSPAVTVARTGRLRRALRFCAAAIVASASLMITGDVSDAQTIRIHDIQGAAHRSPMVGAAVSGVPGIVTSLRTNGFTMEDSSPDASDATSEAIFVFTSSAPTVLVGDSVTVSGTVTEFRPGGASTDNLTQTEITGPTIVRISSGNALPGPAAVGTGGRIPPTTVIEDDATGDVETSGSFDVITDGIDFWESLESMRVQVRDAVAVGPTNSFGELPVLGDNGANASVRTARGGIVIHPGDFNPERVYLDDEILKLNSAAMPVAKVNDRLAPAVLVGIMDYSFGNFKLQLQTLPTVIDGGLTREAAAPAATGEISIAGLNVENLAGSEPQTRFTQFAQLIVNSLRSPDVIALQEIQDNNGATNDAVVDASTTLNRLISAISAAGGPSYEFRQINPVDDQDGGQPGGNIRNAYLYHADRGLSFVDRPGGGSTVATGVVNAAGTPQLQHSPGRIDPANAAWNASRKPLVAEFRFGGRSIFMINNHFNSKGGDDPLYGHVQPPVLSSEVQRLQQAQLVQAYAASILAVDPNANIVVLGDINDFQFSPVLAALKGSNLHDLVSALPISEQYTYVFDGNSQALDHILVSSAMRAWGEATYDVVHVNSEFPDQLSDHEPEIMRFAVDVPPPVVPEAPVVALISFSGLGIGMLVAALITLRSARRSATARNVT